MLLGLLVALLSMVASIASAEAWIGSAATEHLSLMLVGAGILSLGLLRSLRAS